MTNQVLQITVIITMSWFINAMHACTCIATISNNILIFAIIIILQLQFYYKTKLVEDADGDHVRCRWAESSLNECADVCRGFPASLNGRDVRCITIVYNLSPSLIQTRPSYLIHAV